MAEAVSDGETQPAVKPPPKRRRLDPSAVVPVPIYSNKVNSSLHLKPMAPVFTEKKHADDSADDSLSQFFSSRGTTAADLSDVLLSDSEEDEAERVQNKPEDRKKELEAIRCPSPPPTESPVQKQSRQVKQKLSEIDRKLRAVNSLLSPEPQGRRTRSRRGPPSAPLDDQQADNDVVIMNPNDDDDDDVIVINPHTGAEDSPYSSLVREIPLKIRCRTVVHKIPVLSSTPLSDVVSQLSVILKVPPPRLLLLREEVELPTDSTVSELGLGIADIIECVTMAVEEDKSGAIDSSSSIISVRLQGKDRDSTQEFSLHRDAALGSIFSQYLSKMSANANRNVRFQFDGAKVTHSQTPAQLDMEDGDIIEVWM